MAALCRQVELMTMRQRHERIQEMRRQIMLIHESIISKNPLDGIIAQNHNATDGDNMNDKKSGRGRKEMSSSGKQGPHAAAAAGF
ncbi:hypothetical protein H0A73_18030 [Alcaligenaceae bacterium]|nr:hypothetical protein [Alcaligenaceae bacterium]